MILKGDYAIIETAEELAILDPTHVGEWMEVYRVGQCVIFTQTT